VFPAAASIAVGVGERQLSKVNLSQSRARLVAASPLPCENQNIRNSQGAVPMNTPMKEEMWDRYETKQRSRGFTWRTLPVQRFGNGPMLVHHWESTFSRSPTGVAAAGVRRRFGEFLSIHSNCYAKQWMASMDKVGSPLFLPR